jgi:hypothetical protein
VKYRVRPSFDMVGKKSPKREFRAGSSARAILFPSCPRARRCGGRTPRYNQGRARCEGLLPVVGGGSGSPRRGGILPRLVVTLPRPPGALAARTVCGPGSTAEQPQHVRNASGRGGSTQDRRRRERRDGRGRRTPDRMRRAPPDRDPRVRTESFTALVAHGVAMRDKHFRLEVIGFGS